MTGIEAISNAVPVFKPVEWRNARTTLTWMVGLLIALFAGTIAMVQLDGVVPNAHETVLSQLAHRSFGSGFMYPVTQAATAAILLLAANTAYNDFPRVLFLLARDFQAPRLFLRMGDRLAFSNGIILLSLAAAAIFVAFGGTTAPLIPLYAVGVFLAFTLSQSGMVVHWWRLRDRNWRRSMAFNATGAALSAIVFITAGITKFTSGAWVSLVAVGMVILLATRIRRHYQQVAEAIALRPHALEVPGRRIVPSAGANGRLDSGEDRDGEQDTERVRAEAAGNGETEETPEEIHHLTIVPVATLDLPSMRALAYAASLQQPVLTLHVSPTEAEGERFRSYWQTWGDHLPLEVVVSPYRAIVAPMVNYIESLHRLRADLTLTVILPEIVVPRLAPAHPAQPHGRAPAPRAAAAAKGGRHHRALPCSPLNCWPTSKEARRRGPPFSPQAWHYSALLFPAQARLLQFRDEFSRVGTGLTFGLFEFFADPFGQRVGHFREVVFDHDLVLNARREALQIFARDFFGGEGRSFIFFGRLLDRLRGDRLRFPADDALEGSLGLDFDRAGVRDLRRRFAVGARFDEAVGVVLEIDRPHESRLYGRKFDFVELARSGGALRVLHLDVQCR